MRSEVPVSITEDGTVGVVLSTYLSSPDATALRARAAAADRSVAAELRRALRVYLQNDERRALEPGAVEASRGLARHDEA